MTQVAVKGKTRLLIISERKREGQPNNFVFTLLDEHDQSHHMLTMETIDSMVTLQNAITQFLQHYKAEYVVSNSVIPDGLRKIDMT